MDITEMTKIATYASRTHRASDTYEDAQQEAYAAILAARRTFDPTRGTPFGSYAMTAAVFGAQKTWNFSAPPPSFQAEDTTSELEESYADIQRQHLISKHLLAVLGEPLTALVVKYHTVGGVETAKQLKLPLQRVRYLYGRARHFLLRNRKTKKLWEELR